MTLETQLFREQLAIWPQSGRHILAQFDEESVIVYQAFNARIGEFAARHGEFGGDFRATRMSWIKPNFLWMMFRSGWGTKPDQETTLAIRLKRNFWEEILARAVPSSFDAARFDSFESWQRAVENSDVRLQWDPDHAPNGAKLERRAVQLGLRGEMLRRYMRKELLGIEDISEFVKQQRAFVDESRIEELRTPRERIYLPREAGARALGLNEVPN